MNATASNDEKQPFKIIEILLNKFRDEVIPHHQATYQNYKASLEKCINENNYGELQRELRQKHNVSHQLRSLTYELDSLKSQVSDSEMVQFDKCAGPLRDEIHKLVKDHLDLEGRARSKLKYYSDNTLEDDSETVALNNCQLELEGDFIDLRLYDEQKQLQRIEDLNRDISDVHEIFENLHELVEEQKEPVSVIEKNVESSALNTKEGLLNLIKASKLKGASYVVAGTCLGTMVGGPIGSIAGFKIGAVTAIGCGALGYFGGEFFKKRKLQRIKKTEMEMKAMEMEDKVGCDNENVDIKKSQ